MKNWTTSKLLTIVLLVLGIGAIFWFILPEDEIDYNTQVKPILNNQCIACHGGVKQSGGFSLLFEEEAKGNTSSEIPAIIPGSPGKSEIIKRITTHNLEERMPLDKDPLSKEEIKILRNWVKQGAKWDRHWAYNPVLKTEPTDKFENSGEYKSWANNDIDFFIYEKLKEKGLNTSERADLSILARRLSLDIIGLPPPLEGFEQLKTNPSKEGWNAYIETLLSSPHFGEKWAGMWMDLARYSDTKGYERDAPRTIWKYRDWLIKAFNEDKPYNEFITEQIAGDLLPEPTDDQLIATAFHRNTMTNDEGGTDNEEFRIEAVMDRVNTTWEVTMGTTFACVQCHSHTFDPFKHEDYYKFMAFFNNTRDEDTFDDYPKLRHFEGQDSVKLMELKKWLDKNVDNKREKEIIRFVKTWQPSINSLTSDKFVNSELADTKWLVFRNNGSSRLKQVKLDGKDRLIYRYRSFLPGGVLKIHLDSVSGPVIQDIKVKDTKGRWSFEEIEIKPTAGAHDLYFTYFNPGLKNPQSNGLMFDWFYFTQQFPGKEKDGSAKAKEQFWDLIKANTLSTPILIENPEDRMRETRLFERGSWLSPGKKVDPGLPEILDQFPEEGRKDRLGLAGWMVDEQNPLVARTYVNRVWEQLFGTGIVETLEDLGTMGIPPTHPKLLDHLSWKFMNDFNWSTKALLRYLVNSATYQQSSYSSPGHLQIDPKNRYYARGPRIRLTAEQIRDQALVVSGLFSSKMYGPSVMPYQPENIWNSPYSGAKWVRSEGEDQYRRALYTYWKRTSPYPSMVLFDMMAREVCTSRRITTNTPLQALVTLNDSVYVEAAIHFANNMIDQGGNQVENQIRYAYKRMMYRDITAEKLDVMLDLYDTIYREEKLAENSETSFVGSLEERHAKAMVVVANTMLNLDEFITKN